MKYRCDLCNYDTGNKSNYNKHLICKTHVEKTSSCSKQPETTVIEPKIDINLTDIKVEPKKRDISQDKTNLACKFCGTKYESTNGIRRHMVTCAKKNDQTESIKNENIYLKKRIEELTRIINEKDELLTTKEKDMDFIKNIASTAGVIAKQAGVNTEKSLDITKQFTNALQYLRANYNDAPAIQPPSNWNFLYTDTYNIKEITNQNIEDNSEESIEFNDPEYDEIDRKMKRDSKIDKTNEDNFINKLIDDTETGKLAETVGQAIIAFVKKDDPKTQAIWCSDVSRLSYIIKEIIDKNKNNQSDENDENDENHENNDKNEAVSEWIIDKKGTRVSELLIKPLLMELSCITGKYLSRENAKVYYGKKSSDDGSTLTARGLVLIKQLRSDTLTTQIKKYVASALYLKKTGEMERIEE